jgi:hypothetical protein
MKKQAFDLAATADTEAGKLNAIATWCQKNINNISYHADRIPPDVQKKMWAAGNAVQTFELRAGTGDQINLVFYEMALALGMEARLILVPDHSDFIFSPNFPNLYFLQNRSVAVKAGEGWRFYDVSNPALPPGTLRWQEQGAKAYLLDPKQPDFVETSATAAEDNAGRRSAKLKLAADGSVEGTLEVRLTGLLAVEQRMDLIRASAAEREERIKDYLTGLAGAAQYTEFAVESLETPLRDLVLKAKVRVEGYGERTGRRLFLTPAFFQRADTPRFTATERKHDIVFPYGWTEEDEIEWALPAGLELESPDAPKNAAFGQVGHYHPSLRVSNDKRTLFYRRSFLFGAGRRVYFPVANYPTMKRIFDFVHQQDRHQLTLKETANGTGSN